MLKQNIENEYVSSNNNNRFINELAVGEIITAGTLSTATTVTTATLFGPAILVGLAGASLFYFGLNLFKKKQSHIISNRNI
jgi:hypothetical protein